MALVVDRDVIWRLPSGGELLASDGVLRAG
jgi:hypothetical protein